MGGLTDPMVNAAALELLRREFPIQLGAEPELRLLAKLGASLSVIAQAQPRAAPEQ